MGRDTQPARTCFSTSRISTETLKMTELFSTQNRDDDER